MVFLSGMLLFGTGLTAYAYAQGQPSGQFPQSIIVFSDTDTTPHSLELAAIQQGNAESSEVSGLSLDTTNTVTAQPNSQLTGFVTDNTVQVQGAKVRTATDQMIDLNPSTQANAFSIANLPVGGVYT
jgi:hypothetical protein